MTDATRILHAISSGDRRAAEELLPLVYDELRQLAAHRLSSEAPGQTLQPTALVHEAWMRLTKGDETVSFDNRGHFFAAAAEAIRRILIERARSRGRQKRGGGVKPVDIESVQLAAETDDATLLLVDEALQKLEAVNRTAAELVNLRFFAGLTHGEACTALGVSERTAMRQWSFARAWLFREITALQSA